MSQEEFTQLKKGDKVLVTCSLFPHQVVVDIDDEDVITAQKTIFGLDSTHYRVSYKDVEFNNKIHTVI